MTAEINFDIVLNQMTIEAVELALEQIRERHYIVGLKNDEWCVFKNEDDRCKNDAITREDSFLKAVISSISN